MHAPSADGRKKRRGEKKPVTRRAEKAEIIKWNIGAVLGSVVLAVTLIKLLG
jgi:hypothetical protein